MIPRHILAAAAVAAGLAGAPAAAQAPARPAPSNAAALSAEQQTIYALALAAAEQQRWDEVRRAIDVGGHPLAGKILRWLIAISRSGASFEEIAAFLRDNPDWPAPEALQRRAEEAMEDTPDDAAVRAFFAQRTPLTAEGMARLASALQRTGAAAQATALARGFWRSQNLNETQERAFLGRFAAVLGRADHVARLDRLIWDGRHDDARRVLTLVDGETRRIAEARIALATRARTAERTYDQVPAVRRDDVALQFERARFLRRRGDTAEGLAIFAAIRMPPERARAWKVEREIYARRLAESGDAADAYAIARDHGLPVGTGDWAEIEFLAGWIALRYASNPGAAMPHFVRLFENSVSPISRARGAYWTAQAREAARDAGGAAAWYRRAAAYPMTFYGQVALSRIGGAPAWPDGQEASLAERVAFAEDELVQAAQLLRLLDGETWMRAFLVRLGLLADTPQRLALVANLALALGRPDLSVFAAKRATSTSGVTLIEQGWPVVRLPDTAGLDPALVLAVIRQESAFETRAVSRAGAHGLMQLMPATATLVARRLGLAQQHNAARLLDDPGYNIRLGSTYLARGIENFGGSYVLAIAAYNAGPRRAAQWIERNGDPRVEGVDVIDWIERIPFDETRNYVQRVLENLMVYRWRLQPGAAVAAIDDDLRRRHVALPRTPTSDDEATVTPTSQ